MNNKFLTGFRRSLIAFALTLCAAQAQAFILTANFDFQITVNDPADAFVTTYGLATGDLVTGSAVFNSTGATGVGFETFEIINPEDFTITIGSLVLDGADDVDFLSPGLPSIDFLDGEFLRFQFLADVDVASDLYEVSLEDFFEVVDPDGSIVVVNADNLNVSVIPIPAALPLMLSALAGLGVWRRRSIA